jgi:hypothetical protein
MTDTPALRRYEEARAAVRAMATKGWGLVPCPEVEELIEAADALRGVPPTEIAPEVLQRFEAAENAWLALRTKGADPEKRDAATWEFKVAADALIEQLEWRIEHLERKKPPISHEEMMRRVETLREAERVLASGFYHGADEVVERALRHFVHCTALGERGVPLKDERPLLGGVERRRPAITDGVPLKDEPPRMFAMQDGPPIPWNVAAAIYSPDALYGYTQTLERLHERGGGAWVEVAVLWKDATPLQREACVTNLRAAGGARGLGERSAP